MADPLNISSDQYISGKAPDGFIAANILPDVLAQFFGREQIVGYRMVPETDPVTGKVTYQVEVAQNPYSWKGYGFRVEQRPDGSYVGAGETDPSSSGSGRSASTTNDSSGSNSGSTPIASLADAQRLKEETNAIESLKKTFESLGLGSLAGAITEFVKKGYSTDTVTLLLQDTPEYKKRFAANEARRKAGMSVLSPAEYLATEKSYRNIMNAAGLPKGFYDQQEDFTDFLSKDISPGELNARVQSAADAVLNADPYYTQALRDMYGMTSGDMVAFVLNPDRSLPIIQQKANAVSFNAAASRQGVNGVGTSTAEMYGGMGIGKQQSEQGFAQIATQLPRSEQLGDIYGIDYGVNDAIDETFGNNAGAAKKRRKLIQAETDTFGGQSGVRGGTLSQAMQGLI